MNRFMKKSIAYLLVLIMTAGWIPSANLQAAKKASLKTKKVILTTGQKKKISIKKKSKKNSYTFKLNRKAKKIISVNKKGLIKAKKKGTAKIKVMEAYKKNGKKSKRSLGTVKVTVKAKNKPNPTKKPSKSPLITRRPEQTPSVSVPPTEWPSQPPTVQPDREFSVSENGQAANIYLDSNAADFEGLHLIAKAFTGDVKAVSNTTPKIKTDFSELESDIIVAGSIGNNELINKWTREGKVWPYDLEKKRECYKIIVLENPEPDVKRAIVIVGSDKRGTIYGIFRLSELMGVSPWVYWADVPPAKQEEITFTASELYYTSKEPSVKYRGIFINDENPSLSSWASAEFGGFNELFYDKVFELILRNKGNYMWPAMWNSAIGKDGKSAPLASLELADTYGIIMGTSHHEPMMLGEKDWTRRGVNPRYGSDWDFTKNSTGLINFWDDGAKQRGGFENVITLGMRGMNDSPMLPAGATKKDNIDLLKNIITAQKDVLKKNGLEKAPQVLTLYKEVEPFWYGDNTVEGLNKWNKLDDTIAMLTEDNFGNLRTLPTEEARNRKGGWGMYYHFDYHGGPTSYEWINTTPLEKTWEQMSMAYEYGVKDIWIVNVGDIKPMEVGISYFLDMAYDFDKWGTDGLNKTDDYLKQWVTNQFGEGVDEKGVDDLSSLIHDYLQMNGNRKPETLKADTYHTVNENEAQNILDKANKMIGLADEYTEKMPEKLQASYFQLIYYPVVATATVNKLWVYKGLNNLYYRQKRTSANIYARLLTQTITAEKNLQTTYNMRMPGPDKTRWNGMMSSPHVGYITWNSDNAAYPPARYLTPKEGADMLVAPKGTDAVYEDGSCNLPDFNSVLQEHHYIDVANAGDTVFDYTAEASDDWILLTKESGTVNAQDTIGVSIDWNKITENQTGTVTIKGTDKTVAVTINAVYTDTTQITDEMTFVETNNVVSIEANHFSKSVKGADGSEWKVIDHYGRTNSSVKTFPSTRKSGDIKQSPYLEYKVFVGKAGEYTLQTYTAPTNFVEWNRPSLRYGVGVGDETPAEFDTLDAASFMPGEYSGSWQYDVTNNARKKTSKVTLKEGINTIRIYSVDAPLVLQKLVLYHNSITLPDSYLGPQESYYKGKTIASELVVDIQDDRIVPNPNNYVYTDEITLNLKDCKTAGYNNRAPASVFDENGTGTFTFTTNGQKLFIKVPTERMEDIQEAKSISIHIQGSSSSPNALFRCCLALASGQDNWNGTVISNNSGGNTGVSGSDFFHKDLTLTISDSGKTALQRLGHLMIQMNSAGTTEVEISSITITMNH